MRILSRHFLASYLALFVAILLTSLLAVGVIEILLHFDDVLERGRGLSGVLEYMLLRVPSYYLRDLIPVTSFAAAFFCCALAARGREVMALKAGGVSPLGVVVPLLAAAAVLAAASFVVNETLVLGAEREWKRRDGDGEEITFRRGSFWYHRGDVIYNVSEADREAKTLSGVRVYELSPEGRLVRSIRADTVQIAADDRWHLVGATIRRFDTARPTAPPRIEREQTAILSVARRRDLALLDADAGLLSLPDLREYIAAREDEGRDSRRYHALLHARLADPLSVLLFAVLAVPLGLAVEHTRSIALGALQGIVAIGAYYTARTVGSMLAAGGLVPAAETPWALLTAFAGFATWRFATLPR